jgi:pyruvate,orthophosphate dikinase
MPSMIDIYPILRGTALAGGGASEVGGKASNLMRMGQIGLTIPPAFVPPTTWRRRPLPESEPALRAALSEGIARLEAATGFFFGGARRPLLVSVR